MDKSNALGPDRVSNDQQATNLAALSSKEFYDTMLKERRRLTRGIPVPVVHESDSDSDWAPFESMVGERSNTNQPG